MKKMKIILALMFIGAVAFGLVEKPFTQDQVDDAIFVSVNQLGAGGYSATTNVTVSADTWTDVPASFTIPYVSGFSYVTNSTIQYDNGDRWFLFGGNVSINAGVNITNIEVGLETNGVFVVGSTSGPRYFTTSGDQGSMSYAFPLLLSNGDKVGLVIKGDKTQTITINAWQSYAIRF